jgi:four helix bundle protein
MTADAVRDPRPEALSPSVPAETPSAAPADAPVHNAEESLADEVQLDASKLHCYHVALELHAQCSVLVAVFHRVVRDQLERASLSVVLNIAEGGGRRSRRDKARFYAFARGSATEVAALLDVLDRRRLGSPAAITSARRLAIRTVQMLTRIHQRLCA